MTGAASAADAVAITAVTAGGDGVGRLSDGMAVFVPRTAPGDRVRLEGVRRRRRFATAAVAELLEGGAGRVVPRCAHYVRDGCGGCQWQHLGIAAQQEAKRRIVSDALRRIGGFTVPEPPLEASPGAFGYRATITLTVRWRDGVPVVGFHRGDDADVFALERCEIAREELNVLWTALTPALGALPRGDDVRLKLRFGADATLHVVVSGGEGTWPAASAEVLARAAAGAGSPAAVWWQPRPGVVRHLAGRSGDAASVAFAQVNPEVAGRLRAAVVASVPPEAHRVLDLYAGAGDVALAVAGREGGAARREVVAVDVDETAVRQARETARRLGAELDALAARVEDVIQGLLPADVVIANPPRTGLAAAVADALAARPPALLLYVSCDPATLARDLRRLGAGPPELRCFDMFPQTSHVETLASIRWARP